MRSCAHAGLMRMQCRSTAHMRRLTCVWAPWQLETLEQKTTEVKTEEQKTKEAEEQKPQVRPPSHDPQSTHLDTNPTS